MNVPFYSHQGWTQFLAKISCKKPNTIFSEIRAYWSYSVFHLMKTEPAYSSLRKQLFQQEELHLTEIAERQLDLKYLLLILQCYQSSFLLLSLPFWKREVLIHTLRHSSQLEDIARYIFIREKHSSGQPFFFFLICFI